MATTSDALRVLFFGTPDFAVPALRALAASPHEVVGVVSQPDRPRGRGRKLAPTPVAACAAELGIEVIQPEKVGDPSALDWMRERRADLGCVIAFGQFIPKRVREAPPLGLINAHASLLPRHRGAAPIPYSILSGDREAGITIIRVAKEMDAGDWCLERATPIGDGETAGALALRLAAVAGEALVTAATQMARGEATFHCQDHAHATLAPKLDKDFGSLEFCETRDTVLRRFRAASPWPGSQVTLARSGLRLRLVAIARGGDHDGAPRPGAVSSDGRHLRIAARDGWVDVLEVQAPGKRAMDTADFLRGTKLPEGEEIA